MDVRNCSRCGRIYIYDGFNICADCRQEDEKDFQKVKEYLDKNPGANIIEVSEATKVESRKIIEFLKEGRLEVTDKNNILLSCERCGKTITTGRFCSKCSTDIEKELQNALKPKRSDPKTEGAKERIRITDRYRNR